MLNRLQYGTNFTFTCTGKPKNSFGLLYYGIYRSILEPNLHLPDMPLSDLRNVVLFTTYLSLVLSIVIQQIIFGRTLQCFYLTTMYHLATLITFYFQLSSLHEVSFVYTVLSWYSSYSSVTNALILCNNFLIGFESTSVLPHTCDPRYYFGHPPLIISFF